MSESLSLQIGNLLFNNCFPLYNFFYPIYKKKKDAKELQVISSIVKPGYTILDIGANIGFYTGFLSKLAGNNGKVYAFEPELTNFTYLQQNCKDLANVTFVNKAISGSTGPLKIYISKELNVDHRTYAVDDFLEIKEIEAITIDDFLSLNNIEKIDFIKMDIQGFELSALIGMSKTLKSNNNIKIITELWPYGLKKAGTSVSQLVEFISSLNFDMFLITSSKFEKLNEKAIQNMEQNKSCYYNILISK